ncbi:hypothetical protein BDZ90DRAFT_230221 [Jaminaea rosea]|uniref:Uncharacterized protein n=1 Tax=Jaminaea rosea TaxID=1569628 RepID=A0A316UVK4_9BASI|nr:hypothetical protein BDZ90DRAFT_230221 [Jaminaea rosea]PWN29336.1 hypothetical protein BDZ90DRAFT_230221 [Jaminaea rosea]
MPERLLYDHQARRARPEVESLASPLASSRVVSAKTSMGAHDASHRIRPMVRPSSRPPHSDPASSEARACSEIDANAMRRHAAPRFHARSPFSRGEQQAESHTLQAAFGFALGQLTICLASFKPASRSW